MKRPSALTNTLFSFALFAIFLMAGGSDAFAAERDTLKQQREESYARLLANPADRAETLIYTSINLRMSDYESAIPPLERILIREPDNAKIRMQIGVLYKSLGSKLLAREYLTGARDTKGADAKIIEQAKEHLSGL